jgi:hypothetical protein
MTVLELVKNYGLGDFDKHYKNQYGNSCDLMNIFKLKDMEVKGISINFPTKEATITVIEHEEKELTQ